MWPWRPRSDSPLPPAQGEVRQGRRADPARESPSDLGRQGEQLAQNLLRSQGLAILASNYRCPGGEADLIALDASTRKTLGCETLVFVEVKTRSPGQLTLPQHAVDADKQAQLRKVARYYQNARNAHDLAVRYDIVAITMQAPAQPEITHIKGAF